MCFFQTGTVYIGKQWEEMGMGMQQGFPANFLSKPTHPHKGTTKYLQKIGLKNGVAPSFSGTQMCGKRCAAGDAMVGGKLGVSPPPNYEDFSSQNVGNSHGNLSWLDGGGA